MLHGPVIEDSLPTGSALTTKAQFFGRAAGKTCFFVQMEGALPAATMLPDL